MRSRKGRASRPALTHGLTSRLGDDRLKREIESLARVLLASSPHEPDLLDAALDAADAIIRLERIRAYRRDLLKRLMVSPPAPRVGPTNAELRAMATILRRGIKASTMHLIDEFGSRLWQSCDRYRGNATGRTEITSQWDADDALCLIYWRPTREWQRLADYERKALSRRTEAIRRLDLLRIEADRRRVAKEGEEPAALQGSRGLGMGKT